MLSIDLSNITNLMRNPLIRSIVFLVGCIGTRLALAYLSFIASKTQLFVLGIIGAIISLGFFRIYFGGNLRKTGIETGGTKIWWNHLRPFHGTMYAIFAYYALTNNPQLASATIYLDTILGLVAWLNMRVLSR
jgi:hypothetical protein